MSFEKLPQPIFMHILKYSFFNNFAAHKDLIGLRQVCSFLKNVLSPEKMLELTKEMYTTPQLLTLEKAFELATNDYKPIVVEEALKNITAILEQINENQNTFSLTQRNFYKEQQKKWTNLQILLTLKPAAEPDELVAKS